MITLEHITNIFDPRHPSAKDNYPSLKFLQWRLEWLQDKVVTDPKPTKQYTSQQLKQDGYIGVAKRVEVNNEYHI